MKHTIPQILAVTAAAALAVAQSLAQGELDPPGIPAPTMKTLAQIEPRTPISELPVTLSMPGSYYLTANLTGADGDDGITVEADNVTIDLGGFVLTGGAGSPDAIVVSGGHVNLVVKNGTIRGWSGDGVNAGTATDSGFFHLRVADNGAAGLRAGQRSTINDCVATGNLEGGIRANVHSLIRGCTASGNEQAGIAGDGGAVIRDCVAINNVNGAIGIVSGDASVIAGCTSRDNGGNGFYTGAGSVVEGCTATANSGTGVQTSLASTVKGCSAKNNSGSGVWVDFGSTVRDCVSRQNSVNGIESTDRCLILDNDCSENTGNGIRVTGSDNRIEGNHLASNPTGVKVEPGGSGNFIARNTSRGETPGQGFDVPAGQWIGPIVVTGPASTDNPWANFTDASE